MERKITDKSAFHNPIFSFPGVSAQIGSPAQEFIGSAAPKAGFYRGRISKTGKIC